MNRKQRRAEMKQSRPGAVSASPRLDALLATAVLHHQGQRWAEAERLYREILAERPDHPDANHNLGVLAVQVGKPAWALPNLALASDADPGNGGYAASYAETLLALGQIGEADTVVERAVAQGATGPRLDSLRATLRLHLPLWRATAAETGPRISAARAALVRADVAEAQATIHGVLAKTPRDPEALLLAAECELEAGALELARTLAARASSLAPGSTTALALRRKLDEYDASIADDPYVESYLLLRARHMDYPMNIQIETVGRCNAACTFCPHEQIDRKFEEMSDDLFDKIVREASTFPAMQPLNFLFNVVNEPFMDKKIFHRLRSVNEKVPHARLGLISNLNVLPKNFFEEFATVRNLDSFNVSFNAANKDEYERTMKVDFDRTVANIRSFLSHHAETRYFDGPVELSRVSTSDEGDARFVKDCESLFAGFRAGVDYRPVSRSRANWLGRSDIAQARVPYLLPCLQWVNISIFCTGVVPHCCMDAHGDFALGNVNDRTILEIYNSPHFRSLRERALARGPIHPCNTCALR